VDVHLEPRDRPRGAVAHDVHPPGRPVEPAGDRPVRPHGERRIAIHGGAQAVGCEVVRVLVRDEDGGGAVEGVRIGEHPRIDDQPALTLPEDDACVAVHDELHDGILPSQPGLPVPVSEPGPHPLGEGARPHP
jgi:hypothetical protein